MMDKHLSKEVKMDILSKAIDAGADIDIWFHLGGLEDKVNADEALELLSGMTHERTGDQNIKFNNGNEFLSDFDAMIFFPADYAIPVKWREAGEVV